MSTYNEIEEGSIILAPSYLHPLIRQELLKQRNGYISIQVLSASSWLTSHIQPGSESKTSMLFHYAHVLKSIQSQLTIFSSMISSWSFLEECSSFITSMKEYDILPDDLPMNDESQIERKNIIEAIYPIPQPIDDEKRALKLLMQDEDSCKHIYIAPSFTTLYEKQRNDILIAHGAHIITREIPEPEISFFHSVNLRQEIEACAQYIIEHKLSANDINITLASSTYKPFLEQIFKRYQIPYTMFSRSQASDIVKKFNILLSYCDQPNKQNLMEVLTAGIYRLPYLKELCGYLEVFDKDIHDDFNHIHKASISGDFISIDEYNRLKKQEEHAQEAKSILYPKLQELLRINDLAQLSKQIYQTISEHAPKHITSITIFKNIQTVLKDALPYIKSKADIPFLISALDTIKETSRDRTICGCLIHDLNHPLPYRTYHFMLGLTQSDYPKFPNKSGIFNEDYYQFINYPTMDERYAHHMHQLDQQIHSSAYLILSYPQGDFNGKGKEAALEIETLAKQKSKEYPLITHEKKVNLQANLNRDTAESLYLHDQEIRGSVSAFERYAGCPFSYFIRYGLHIKEPMDASSSNAHLGTLAHFILEELVNKEGKNYIQSDDDTIKALLHEKIEEACLIYPSSSAAFHLIEQRLFISLKNTLEILKDMEEHTSFEPFKTEYEFHRRIPIDETNCIHLKGFIDRIDHNGEALRIIDYKSSAKTLSEKNVFTARQLQLLTYAMVAQDDFKLPCAGVYYHSLKSENNNIAAGKMNRRQKMFVPFNEEDYEEQRTRAQRLNGWHMSENLERLDDDARHIASLTQNKDGMINARKIYSMDGVSNLLLTLYQRIAQEMLSGNIKIEPDDDACMFCKYHDICRFHGFPITKEPLAEVNDDFYIKGGKADDEME